MTKQKCFRLRTFGWKSYTLPSPIPDPEAPLRRDPTWSHGFKTKFPSKCCHPNGTSRTLSIVFREQYTFCVRCRLSTSATPLWISKVSWSSSKKQNRKKNIENSWRKWKRSCRSVLWQVRQRVRHDAGITESFRYHNAQSWAVRPGATRVRVTVLVHCVLWWAVRAQLWVFCLHQSVVGKLISGPTETGL